MKKIKYDKPTLAFYRPHLLDKTLADLQRELANAEGKDEREAAAAAIIKEYHTFFGGDEMQKDLWFLLAAALTHPDLDGVSGEINRSNLFFFYEFTLMLFNAMYVLHGKERYGKMV
jgi:hypothetical protein